jgi:hypothetical protein
LQNARDPFAGIRQRPDHVDGRGRLRFRVQGTVRHGLVLAGFELANGMASVESSSRQGAGDLFRL